jgi:hypothetical protein
MRDVSISVGEWFPWGVVYIVASSHLGDIMSREIESAQGFHISTISWEQMRREIKGSSFLILKM